MHAAYLIAADTAAAFVGVCDLADDPHPAIARAAVAAARRI
jgi:hypothetical protein